MGPLAARRVAIMNMSLSGHANAAFKRLVSKITDAKIVLVAAVGDEGPASNLSSSQSAP
jgi:hypothetical protein